MTSASMLTLTPEHTRSGAGASTDPNPAWSATGQAVRRAGEGYFDWLEHVWAAAGCTQPVLLHGDVTTIDTRTGETRIRSTDDMPDGLIYKACGNRRAHSCPSCAETYRRDAYQVIRAGLVGGKIVDATVALHPAVFATFTAPSFGPVHTRVVAHHTCSRRDQCACRAKPCRARRDITRCPHGVPLVCTRRHSGDDSGLGQPLCPECYDHAAHVMWNHHAGELWRRTRQDIERRVIATARNRGIPFPYAEIAPGKWRQDSPVRVSYAKVAEYQRRGVVHYHALLRLDGVDPDDPAQLVPPPPGLAADVLQEAIVDAAGAVSFTTRYHPYAPEGWVIAWGSQLDVRTVKLAGDGSITDTMVAAYLAKYSTKSSEVTGHTSRRLDSKTVTYFAHPFGNHTERLIAMCWSLSQHPYWHGLARWAHMLGFGGHFLTKARRYSFTFGYLRGLRVRWRRAQPPPGTDAGVHAVDVDDDETTLVIGNLSYAGSGWQTLGDAMLANTAAALARDRERIGRQEAADQQAA